MYVELCWLSQIEMTFLGRATNKKGWLNKLQEGRGSALIRYSQQIRLLNGMQSEKEDIIALHQHSIHRFEPISNSNKVTLSEHHLQWPLGANTEARKPPLYISHHHLPWSYPWQKPMNGKNARAFRVSKILSTTVEATRSAVLGWSPRWMVLCRLLSLQ